MSTKSSSSLNKSKSKVKTDTFYIGDDNNSKGIVVRTASTPNRSTVRSVPNVSIKEKEENVTTKDVNEVFFLNVLYYLI